jgi:tetratricopeptide (TPR) repeat protein
VNLPDADWNRTLRRLEDLRLISRFDDRGFTGILTSSGIDCHPVIREYFASRLQSSEPIAWKSAHHRLYEHLSQITPYQPETQTGILPLYYAVAHGCKAGRHEEALNTIYRPRIKRDQGYFSTRNLGMFSAELSTLYHYFTEPWKQAIPTIPERDQAWVYHEAGYDLQAQGRLTEAIVPMRQGLSVYESLSDWHMAATCAGDLSDLLLALGEVAPAIESASKGVTLADRTDSAFLKSTKRSTLAHALHQANKETEALHWFEEAEKLQVYDDDRPLLYSLRGYQYSTLLISDVERLVWKVEIAKNTRVRKKLNASTSSSFLSTHNMTISDALERCDEVIERTRKTMAWIVNAGGKFNVAIGYLTVGRTETLKARLLNSQGETEDRTMDSANVNLNAAVSWFSDANTTVDLPRALLARADLYAYQGEMSRAASDLRLAHDIAERNRMALYLIDIRLMHAYWTLMKPSKQSSLLGLSSQMDEIRRLLAETAFLVEKYGYSRRDFEIHHLRALT